MRVLPWPARSPDLNPIEHIWDIIDRRARPRRNRQTIAELEADLRAEWAALGPSMIANYINSMQARCQAMIRANGGGGAHPILRSVIVS